MATISLDIPDNAVSRVVDALCARGHWSSDLGITKNAFAKAELARFVKELTLAYETRTAQQAALTSVVVPPPPDVT